MKRSICLLLSLILLLSFSMISCVNNDNSDGSKERVTGDEKIINVYLIAGQSNAVGYGMDTGNKIASSDERFTKGFENVLYYGAQERWNGEALDIEFQPVTLGMGVQPIRSGAEIGIANAVGDYDEMSAIIKCAWGATHLYPDTTYDISKAQGTWTSPTYIKNNNVDLSANPLIGNMYNRFEETVTKALELLVEQGYTPVIKGVWWMQGEAEMFTLEMASAYRELLTALIYDTRDMLSRASGYDCSSVPFICGLPKYNTSKGTAPMYQGMVRTAISTVAGEVDNVDYIDCSPLTQHDEWHFNAAGQKYLGEGFVALLENLEIENNSYFNEKVSIDDEIKLLADEQGLEFKANLTNYDSKNGYEYGFIFVETAKLDENGINGEYFDALDEHFVEYKRISAEVKLEENGDYSDIYFTGKLSDVLYEKLNTSYTAIAYIKNPEGLYSYSSRYVSASVSGLASEELYREGADVSAAKKLVNAGINFANGVSFENRYNDAQFELILPENITIGITETAVTQELVLEKSVDVDYFVKYSSSNENVVSVDENGVLTAKKKGSATVTVECAGKSASVPVTVGDLAIGGVTFDCEISDGEYAGDVIEETNGSLSVKFAGMIKDGNLYMSFELTHGEWSPLNSSWWLNDNIEFKLNSGTSYTVIFYEGVATYSSNITHGVSSTEQVDGKYVTTVELCVEGVDASCNIKVGFNGTNFSWLGALWNDNYEVATVDATGISKK